MLELDSDFTSFRKLENHVENRTVYTLKNAELNIFETHLAAEQVHLTFGDPVLASMIKGKKIMHLNGIHSFDFLPGESVILPPGELMKIDFPEATQSSPTQCLALSFGKEKLAQAANTLNAAGKKENGSEWSVLDYNYHFTNDVAVNQILQRLIFLFAEDHSSRDFFCDLMLQELIIRIFQTENKSMYLKRSEDQKNSNRFTFIINYIRENITENLSVIDLSQKANMSESHFYKMFKQELGLTPNDFVIEQRLKLAESLLNNEDVSIKEVYLSSGFNSFSYFCRSFKKKHHLSPTEYKEKMLRF